MINLDQPDNNKRVERWTIDAGMEPEEGYPRHIGLMIPELITQQDAAALTMIAKGRKRVLEIGTFSGASTAAILSGMPKNGTLWSVDLLESPKGAHGSSVTPLWARMGVLKTRIPDDPRLNLLLCGSERAAEIMIGMQFDMIFIDGDHTYKGVMRGFELWWPHLAPGGVFCGHDADKALTQWDYKLLIEHSDVDDYNGYHMGVMRAIHDFFHHVEVCDDRNSTVWRTKHGDQRKNRNPRNYAIARTCPNK